MAARKITRITKNRVIIKREDWTEMWRRLTPHIVSTSLANGCADWCENVCEGNDGCDLAGGEPGECVALCNDGEVFLQV